ATTGGGAKAGTFNLFVTTPEGTSAANIGDYFTYEPGPTVSKVSPNNGPTTGGTSITITGTGFATGATVTIGQGNGTTGAVAATVTSITSTTITATTGGGAKAGTFNLFVTTPEGTSAANIGDHFTY
ncbi:MAG TPA: IPT/TIG domain-containing protein, partial [Acidimicrobiales bacterium]|nr:IPT/TIG domain-containing protein [Acidimicrobiales bacterium]